MSVAHAEPTLPSEGPLPGLALIVTSAADLTASRKSATVCDVKAPSARMASAPRAVALGSIRSLPRTSFCVPATSADSRRGTSAGSVTSARRLSALDAAVLLGAIALFIGFHRIH